MRLISIILVGIALCPVLAGPGTAKAKDMAWTNDQAMLIFFEAVTKIKKHALDPSGAGQITRGAIKAYMNRHDPYGDYLSPVEYRDWKQAQQYTYQGIGMEIIERNGLLYCLPKPSSPAQISGIKQGDELVAVDGEPVSGRSIYWVGSRIRGEENSSVKLKVNNKDSLREFQIQRRPLKDKSVWLNRSGGLGIIRISHFSPQTFEEIKTILQTDNTLSKLVLDLRNNPGGDLFAAVDIAGLFLPAGSEILTVETNNKKMPYTAKGRIWNGEKFGIWQNGFTASASEVLIAGLTANHKAISLGSATHGKAMTQSVIKLADGSALIISRGRLIGPDGETWQTKGLEPMFNIDDSVKSWVRITRRKIWGEQ